MRRRVYELKKMIRLCLWSFAIVFIASFALAIRVYSPSYIEMEPITGDGLSSGYKYITALDVSTNNSTDSGAACDVDGIMAVMITRHGYFSEKTWKKGQIKEEIRVLYNEIYEMGYLKNVKKFVNKYDTMLITGSETRAKFNKIYDGGVYSKTRILGSPFVNVNWSKSVSSKYGWRKNPQSNKLDEHNALDIPMEKGTGINAVMGGVVTGINSQGQGYGKHIVITNGTYKTLYAHLSRIKVGKGERIKEGTVIGKVGSTGNATGTHLHLELWKGKLQLNPYIYCKTH